MEKLFGFSFDKTTWTLFDVLWPWIGLGIAITLLILLVATDTFRHNFRVSRWHDAVWLSWLAIPVYMMHQFEEYGIDLLGQRHAFPDALCNKLSLGNYPACSMPHEFYLFVNISLVWFFAVLAAKSSTKNSFVGLGLYSIIITNGMVHIMAAIVKQEYNPGLFTAIVILLPSFFWLCKTCFGKDGLPKKGIPLLIGTGIIGHAVLISSILLFINQKISRPALDVTQIINASLIILLPWLGSSSYVGSTVKSGSITNG